MRAIAEQNMVDAARGDKDAKSALDARQQELAELMETSLDNWKKFSEGPTATAEGKELGAIITELQARMEKASQSLEGFETFNEDIAGQTAATSRLIGELTALNDDTVGVMKNMRKEINRIAEIVGKINEEGD